MVAGIPHSTRFETIRFLSARGFYIVAILWRDAFFWLMCSFWWYSALLWNYSKKLATMGFLFERWVQFFLIQFFDRIVLICSMRTCPCKYFLIIRVKTIVTKYFWISKCRHFWIFWYRSILGSYILQKCEAPLNLKNVFWHRNSLYRTFLYRRINVELLSYIILKAP